MENILKYITANIPLCSNDLHGITQTSHALLSGSKFKIALSYKDLYEINPNNNNQIFVSEKRAIFIKTKNKITELNIKAYKKSPFDYTTKDKYKSPAIISIIPGTNKHLINKLYIDVSFKKLIKASFFMLRHTKNFS